MSILLIILTGISLSMDTFSLAVGLGTFNISNKKKYIFSFIVGIFHFFMPILGNIIGRLLNKAFIINSDKLLFIVFCFIAIEMIISIVSKDEKLLDLTIINMLIYAFSVSIDSFSIGIGLNNLSFSPLIFMLISAFFTFLGLKIGNYTFNKNAIMAKYFGLIIIIIVAILHLINTLI